MLNECSTPIPASYDYRLVAVSVLIAIVSSYAAIDLAGRIAVYRGRARLAWLTGGASAMGSGIWAMHYIGMLAFRMPIPVSYHVPTVLLSLLAAVLASFVGLEVVGRERITPPRFAVGGVLMGVGIATMHYTGMAAMRLPAMHHYDHALFVLSIVLAIVISLVGLLVLSRFRAGTGNWQTKFAASVILGLAIPITHYTGMAAVHFSRSVRMPDMRGSVDISALANVAIVIVVFLILTFSVVTSLLDRQFAQQAVLKRTEQTLREAYQEAELFINAVPSILIGLNHDFIISRWNAGASVAFGLSPEEVLGKSLASCGIRWLWPNMEEEMRGWSSQKSRCDQIPFERDGKKRLLGLTLTPVDFSERAAFELLLIGSDVTDRTALEEQLRQAQKLEAIGQLAAGIAHEINTPTQYIGDNVRF